jgi:electron transport complex protein RnfD
VYWLHAVVIGLLLALTLPVSVGWRVPVVGGLLAIGLGKELLGGLGNSLWHPALVGRAAVALLFAAEVAPDSYPFLARGHLVTGSPSATADTDPLYHGFELSTPPYGAEAWSMQRPVDVLAHRCYGPTAEHDASAGSLVQLFRDHLPPWPDTIWGSVGGGIGETCLPALLLGGLWLIYRGHARWQLPVSAIAAVAVLAAIWPIQLGAEPTQSNSPAACWFPLLHTEGGLHVGVAVVLFHLTGGGLWLACLLIATDPVASPLTSRGQIIFGLALGTCIMVIRCNPWYPGLPGGEYWAVLGLSTLVPLIDRIAPRRVLGT